MGKNSSFLFIVAIGLVGINSSLIAMSPPIGLPPPPVNLAVTPLPPSPIEIKLIALKAALENLRTRLGELKKNLKTLRNLIDLPEMDEDIKKFFEEKDSPIQIINRIPVDKQEIFKKALQDKDESTIKYYIQYYSTQGSNKEPPTPLPRESSEKKLPPPPDPRFPIGTSSPQQKPPKKTLNNIDDLKKHLKNEKPKLDQLDTYINILNANSSQSVTSVTNDFIKKIADPIGNALKEISPDESESKIENISQNILKVLNLSSNNTQSINFTQKIFETIQNSEVVDTIIEKIDASDLPNKTQSFKEHIKNAKSNSLNQLKENFNQSTQDDTQIPALLNQITLTANNPLISRELVGKTVIQELQNISPENQSTLIEALVKTTTDHQDNEEQEMIQSKIQAFTILLDSILINQAEKVTLSRAEENVTTAMANQPNALVTTIKDMVNTNQQLIILEKIIKSYESSHNKNSDIQEKISEKQRTKENIYTIIKTFLTTIPVDQHEKILQQIIADINGLSQEKKKYPLIQLLKKHAEEMLSNSLDTLTLALNSKDSITKIDSFIKKKLFSEKSISDRIFSFLATQSDNAKSNYFQNLREYILKLNPSGEEASQAKKALQVILTSIEPSSNELETLIPSEVESNISEEERLEKIISHLNDKEKEILKNNPRLKMLNNYLDNQIREKFNQEKSKLLTMKETHSQFQDQTSRVNYLSAILDIIKNQKTTFNKIILQKKKNAIFPEEKEQELLKYKTLIEGNIKNEQDKITLSRIIDKIEEVGLDEIQDLDDDDESDIEKLSEYLFQLKKVFDKRNNIMGYEHIAYNIDLHTILPIPETSPHIFNAIKKEIYKIQKQNPKKSIKNLANNLEDLLGKKQDQLPEQNNIKEEPKSTPKTAQEILIAQNELVLKKRREKIISLLHDKIEDKKSITDDHLKELIKEGYVHYTKLNILKNDLRFPSKEEIDATENKAQSIIEKIFERYLLKAIEEQKNDTRSSYEEPLSPSIPDLEKDEIPEVEPSTGPTPSPIPKAPNLPSWPEEKKSKKKSKKKAEKETENIEIPSNIITDAHAIRTQLKDLSKKNNKTEEFKRANSLFAEISKTVFSVDHSNLIINDNDIKKIENDIDIVKNLIQKAAQQDDENDDEWND